MPYGKLGIHLPGQFDCNADNDQQAGAAELQRDAERLGEQHRQAGHEHKRQRAGVRHSLDGSIQIIRCWFPRPDTRYHATAFAQVGCDLR